MVGRKPVMFPMNHHLVSPGRTTRTSPFWMSETLRDASWPFFQQAQGRIPDNGQAVDQDGKDKQKVRTTIAYENKKSFTINR